MKTLLTVTLLVTCLIGRGQNLVPNPSFEVYDTCPDFASQIERANGWYSVDNTPEYFNSCAVGYNWCTVPSNYFGYRTPASGNGYAGIIARWAGINYLKEAIAIQLLNPLQTGIKYYVSFKVSLAGHTNPADYCGINKLGMLFSTFTYNKTSHVPVCSNCAQICSDSIIIDTVNWTRITGFFIADSIYSNINIGRFNFNALTDSIQLAGTGCNAYYYIDDVCVSTDSAYSYNYSYTDIENLEQDNSVKCFPNPFTTQLTFTLTENVPTTVSLYNFLGQQVLQQSFTNTTTINTAQMQDGIYFYELRSNKGSLKTGKLVKQ